jgi:aarF domain-containing kinase
VKIQYPGVAASIDSDLLILKRVAKAFSSVSGHEADLDPVFQELARVLHQEANYELELSLMTEYRERLAGDTRYRVPQAFPEYSSRRVLTMSWEPGVPLEVWLRSRPSLERRERIAHSLLDLFCMEFFDWGLVQTDPNFANFLISPDDALVLLDFGATLRYPEDFRSRYRGLLAVMASQNADDIVAEGLSFGLIDRRESAESKRLFAELLIHSLEPFLASNQPFSFEDVDYAKKNREAGTNFVRSLKYSPPPHSILFLHRKLGGIFNFAKRLSVRLDLGPYWKKMAGADLPMRG